MIPGEEAGIDNLKENKIQGVSVQINLQSLCIVIQKYIREDLSTVCKATIE